LKSWGNCKGDRLESGINAGWKMVGGWVEKSANGRATFPIEEFSILLMCHFGRFPVYMAESVGIGVKTNFLTAMPAEFFAKFRGVFLYNVELINILHFPYLVRKFFVEVIFTAVLCMSDFS